MNIINSLQRGTSAFNDIELKLKAKGVIGQEVVPVEDYPERIDDIVGGNLQTKSVTVATNGSSEINPDSGYDGLEKVNLTVAVPVPTIEQNKTATISQNGTTTINPSSGNDAMDAVEVTVAVPVPTIEQNKTATISQNGITTITPSSGNDAMDSVEVTVDVTVPEITDLGYFFYKNFRAINDWIGILDFSKVTDFQYAFAESNISSIDLGTRLKATNYKRIFSNCNNLQRINIPHLIYPSTNAEKAAMDFSYLLYYCTSLEEITADDDPLVLYGNAGYMFTDCSALLTIPKIKYIMMNYQYQSSQMSLTSLFSNLSHLEEIEFTILDQQATWHAGVSFSYMFRGCSSLKRIKGNLNMSHASGISSMFMGCSNLISIETTGQIGVTVTSAMTLDLSASAVFDLDSFIDSLATNTTNLTRTIKVHSTVYNNFTKQSVATAKHYTIQSA